MQLFRFLILSVLFYPPLLSIGQSLIHPKQHYFLSSDTLFWEIPGLNAKSFLLFSTIEPEDKLNIHVSDQPLTFVLGKEKGLELRSTGQPVKEVYDVSISYKEQTKNIKVVYFPPFKPAFSKQKESRFHHH